MVCNCDPLHNDAVTAWRVPLSDVRVDDELLDAASSALASGWWSMGPRVEQLEARFSADVGVAHALAVSSGTAALQLALLAVGCGNGDEVVLPALNFVAAANVVVRVGATPVFCDIVGPDDLNLDPVDLAEAVGPRTKAVIVLHYGGYACDLGAVLDAVDGRGIAVVEDAAHAPGATWDGRHVGSVGDVGCFSFFANKNIPVGEGGMVVTSSDVLADRLRLLRSHGMTTLTWQRHQGHASAYDVVEAGFNFRFDEMRAALAMIQLDRLAERNRARQRHVRRYRELLQDVDGLSSPFLDERRVETSAHHLAVVVLDGDVSRDTVRHTMQAHGVQTSVHYPPIHHLSTYARAGDSRPLPRTEAVAERVLTLPLFPHMSDSDLECVVEALTVGLSAGRA